MGYGWMIVVFVVVILDPDAARCGELVFIAVIDVQGRGREIEQVFKFVAVDPSSPGLHISLLEVACPAVGIKESAVLTREEELFAQLHE